MQAFESAMREYNIEKNRNKTRCSLLENYLNYAQEEQPFGGLLADSQLAVTDALVTAVGASGHPSIASQDQTGFSRVASTNQAQGCLWILTVESRT